LNRSDFEYHLPEHLIAQKAAERRDGSRMLVLHSSGGRVEHARFTDLERFLSGNELIVYNDSRVIPARMWAHKESGGRVEVLKVRALSGNSFEAMTRSGKPLREGRQLRLERTGLALTVVAVPRPGRAHLLIPEGWTCLGLARKEGTTPLPPYIRRPPGRDDEVDRQRYQTVYAEVDGSVAAPTAGLHFTRDCLDRLRQRGCLPAAVTLHVGPGTFQPVRVDEVEEHRMEEEHFHISQGAAETINRARGEGRPLVAVGTTTVRCLEAAATQVPGGWNVQPGQGSTDLFIYPGYQFRMVDKLLTNFHLPGSTLIMLVSALGGRVPVMEAYGRAVAEQYRFYSFGDCMLVL